MKNVQWRWLLVFAVLGWTACQKSSDLAADSNAEIPDHARHGYGEAEGKGGHVYILSNQVSGNEVLDYIRHSDGSLSYSAAYSTNGQGTGAGLGNQGAMTMDESGRFLLAVNPGSNSISAFRLTGSGLKLTSSIASNGEQPVSITEKSGLVYVLNSGGSGNIAGFRLSANGRLVAIPHAVKPLSNSSAGAAQVSFALGNRVLAITEKANNKIITYTLNWWGIPESMHQITSANATPFGFAVGVFGNIYVSEAAGGAPGASTLSSYRVHWDGSIEHVQGPVSAGQSAACWVVLLHNGRHAYTTNTGSNNLSSFNIRPFSGSISLNTAEASPSDMGPIDAAVTAADDFLYVLTGGGHSINAYEISQQGDLSPLQTVNDLPAGATGCVVN